MSARAMLAVRTCILFDAAHARASGAGAGPQLKGRAARGPACIGVKSAEGQSPVQQGPACAWLCLK